MHALFSHAFAEDDFPNQFRYSKHGPIFKKGDKSDPDNYRGIAVGNRKHRDRDVEAALTIGRLHCMTIARAGTSSPVLPWRDLAIVSRPQN